MISLLRIKNKKNQEAIHYKEEYIYFQNFRHKNKYNLKMHYSTYSIQIVQIEGYLVLLGNNKIIMRKSNL